MVLPEALWKQPIGLSCGNRTALNEWHVAGLALHIFRIERGINPFQIRRLLEEYLAGFFAVQILRVRVQRMAARAHFAAAHVFAKCRDEARLTAHETIPWIFKSPPSYVFGVDGQITVRTTGEVVVIDAVAAGAANAIQTQLVRHQVVHGVAIGARRAGHVRFMKSLGRVACRANVFDGFAVRRIDQTLVVNFGLPKRVARAVCHQRRLPISHRTHRSPVFIDQRFAIRIRRVAIHTVPRTGEVNAFLRAQLTHPPTHPLRIILAVPVMRIFRAGQNEPQSHGH